MNKLLYQSVKVTIATVVAIFIAELLQLNYSTTAGVIAMLSVLDTRKQSLVVGLKRLGASSVAVILAIILFNTFGHHLWVLGIFLMLFIPASTWLQSTEALSVGTVLVTHVYSINTTGAGVFFNELALLFVGVIMGWMINLHMLNIEGEIRDHQKKTESAIKDILNKMKLQLLNQCSVDEQVNLLEILDDHISEGMSKAVQYNNNHILKDYSYFEKYFTMRRQQYFVLKHMQNHFRIMFIAVSEAKLLSDHTGKLADQLNECNDGMTLMAELNALKDHYRKSPLPKTREEFENRATLYQYMNDLAYFTQIKMGFLADFGDIHYC